MPAGGQARESSDVAGLDIQRVAGAERERPSDTWYLKLQLRTRTHTVGRYDSQISALLARRELGRALQAGAQMTMEPESGKSDADPR